MPRETRAGGVAVLAVLVALFAAAPAGADPPLASKRAEAKRVLAQIQTLDARLGRVVEAYNAAQVRLDEIRAEQRENRRHLRIARGNFSRSQDALEKRLLALYTTGDASLVEILLGAESLDDLLAQVDAVDRVSDQDARIVREIIGFRREVRRREAALERARRVQTRVVEERAATRREIEGQLGERRRLFASIEDEIERIEAAEAERQRRLEQEARRRLATSRSEGGSTAPDGGSAPAGGSAAGSSQSSAGGSSGGSGGSGGAAPAARYGGVVGIAMRYLGVPYRWGGASPETGFDCSGFVLYVYSQVGVSLPHSAAAQYGYGTAVSRSQLAPGDLVFFNGLGHNGIYIGGNQFIHSPHTGDVVKISTISGWYASTWVGARRL